MKKCPFCGKENKDAAKFCTGCGKTLEDVVIEPDPPEWNEPAPAPAPAPSQTPAFAPAPAPAAPKAAQPAGVRRTPAQAKLKELAGSKLALVICIAFTVMLLFSICTSAMLPAQMADEVGKAFDSLDVADLEDLIEDAGLDIDVQEVYDAIRDFTEESLNRPVNMVRSLFSAASSNIVSILIAVALWIVYGVAKDENSVCCGTTGLKIIRVLRILGLILGIIVMVVALLALIFCIYMFAREGVEEGRVVMIVLTVIFAVIFLLIFLMRYVQIALAAKYDAMRMNEETGVPDPMMRYEIDQDIKVYRQGKLHVSIPLADVVGCRDTGGNLSIFTKGNYTIYLREGRYLEGGATVVKAMLRDMGVQVK